MNNHHDLVLPEVNTATTGRYYRWDLVPIRTQFYHLVAWYQKGVRALMVLSQVKIPVPIFGNSRETPFSPPWGPKQKGQVYNVVTIPGDQACLKVTREKGRPVMGNRSVQ